MLLDYLDANNKNVIFALSLRQEISMSNDKELEEDLQFYLRRHHQLSSRSRNMKAVVEAEIKRLEEEIKSLGGKLY